MKLLRVVSAGLDFCGGLVHHLATQDQKQKLRLGPFVLAFLERLFARVSQHTDEHRVFYKCL